MSHQIFKLPNNKEQSVPINLLYISHSQYDKEWHSTPHEHQFTEVFYIKKGRGYFIIDRKKVAITKGDLVIIEPNIKHTESSSEHNSLEYITLGFEGISFDFSTDKIYSPGFYIHSEKENEYFDILNNILKEVKNKQKSFEIICQNLLEILIVKILREGQYTISPAESININSNVFTAKNYIDQFFKHDISLDKLAEVSHMNKFYLSHSFKEAMGASPIEYLNNIRVNEAKILLEATNYSISEISDFIGFSSQSYFSQSFKKNTGISPSKYRKESKSI